MQHNELKNLVTKNNNLIIGYKEWKTNNGKKLKWNVQDPVEPETGIKIQIR